MIHVMAGIKPDDAPYEAAREVYLENVSWAAKLARNAGVRLVLEAVNQRDVPGFFLRTLEEGVDVISLAGEDNVGLLFDIYHCQMAQGDVSRRLETLMPLVDHIQVADTPLRSEPGTGELAWPFIFDRIASLRYTGWIGCEYRPASDTQSGLAWRDQFGGDRAAR